MVNSSIVGPTEGPIVWSTDSEGLGGVGLGAKSKDSQCQLLGKIRPRQWCTEWLQSWIKRCLINIGHELMRVGESLIRRSYAQNKNAITILRLWYIVDIPVSTSESVAACNILFSSFIYLLSPQCSSHSHLHFFT